MQEKKRGLGPKGVQALLSSLSIQPSDTHLRQIPIENIEPGPYQPRQDINLEDLKSLQQSIKQHGVLQPILVFPLEDNRYTIIAGERRWRAAQLAGLKNIPAIVHTLSSENMALIGLLENIQREDLNPLDKAFALKRIQIEFNWTHQKIADQLGLSRAHISNLLRLLDLPESIQTHIKNKELEMGHARALLTLPLLLQLQVTQAIITQNLSVRQTEKMVANLINSQKNNKEEAANKLDPNMHAIAKRLTEHLGMSVQMQYNSHKKRGKMIISYNLEQFSYLLKLLDIT